MMKNAGNILGQVFIGPQSYFFYIKENSTEVGYVLLHRYHKDDIKAVTTGELPQHNTLDSVMSIEKYGNLDYALEILTKARVSGKLKYYNNYIIIQKLLDTISFASMYHFFSNDISIRTSEVIDGELVETFEAKDSILEYRYIKANQKYAELFIKYKEIEIDLARTSYKANFKKIELKGLDKSEDKKKILLSSLKSVTYEMLKEALDMSWYEYNGAVKKKYECITTIKDFEDKIMTPLIERVEYCQATNQILDVAIDTETTGLNINCLSKDNPIKDHCVAIPISWEDNAAYVIFTDMEYFDSIDNKYVMERLEPLIGEHVYDNIISSERKEIARKINICKVTEKKIEQDFAVSNVFGIESLDDKKSVRTETVINTVRTVTFYRNVIDLIGHNSIFDGKVFYDYGVRPWFDDDTLQMAFCLNATTVRGSRKLKILTRKLFGHETPELEDVLGKGNEDKYRYLTDKLVATIYGCADADYTRLLKQKLRKMMSDKMYKEYRAGDMPLYNILYVSEYYGMPIEEKEAMNLAKNTEENIEILKDFMFSYVGKIVYIKQQYDIISEKNKAGYYTTEDEYKAELNEISINIPDNARFEFEVKGSTISYVMYGILGYPIYGYTNGDANGANKKPKTDSVVMKKLMRQTREANEKGDKGWRLTHDILVSGADREEYDKLIAAGENKQASYMCLISAKRFNELKYPLALVLTKYAEINKEYTSYLKPIRTENLEGRLFKNYNLARIETRRIANAGQTMKGNLKALVRSIGDDWNTWDFDMSQVEYRIMASRAQHEEIIEKMKDPEKDYHIETAALVFNTFAYLIDHTTRKKTKCIGFGVPYGLTIFSLSETLFGSTEDWAIFETQLLLTKWEKSNLPIIEFLEKARDSAMIPRNISLDLRNFMDAWEYDVQYNHAGKLISKEYKLDANGNKIPIPIGMVENGFGFYRTFDLNGLKDNRRKGTIRRQAGNYGIQSYAAELFKRMLIRFYEHCIYYGIQDKVVWHMLIHDELLLSVHKSVHPFLMYKIIKEACMFTMPGHTNYFVGINVGKTWADAKNDEREAPVHFVNRMIKRYEAGEFDNEVVDDAWEYIKPFREQYIQDRIGECIRILQPGINNEPINLPLILEQFVNYTVRAYVKDYPANFKVEKPAENAPKKEHERYDSLEWISHFETWALKVFGEGKAVIDIDGKLYKLSRNMSLEETRKQSVDFDSLFAKDDLQTTDTYWSFDSGFIEEGYSEVFDNFEEDDFFSKHELIENKDATTIVDLIAKPKKYTNLLVTRRQIIINIKGTELSKCKEYLKSFINTDKNGKGILLKTSLQTIPWYHVNEEVDLEKLDKEISSWR